MNEIYILDFRFILLFQQNSNNEKQFQRTIKYFSELSEETIKSLYEIYKVDFEMFDYSLKPFLVAS